MKEKKIVLKRKKTRFSLSKLFADKKKRYLFMFLFILPFFIAIIIFGVISYREVKSLMALANNEKVETKAENIIESANYILRDNPTDLQKEYFKELKDAIEGSEEVDRETLAGLVAKNYVADFYTWTNKRGQYDIGGLYYVYDGEFPNSDHYKPNVYLKARDGFYKYLSYYATQYGAENLIEVENVEVVSSTKQPTKYIINEHSANKQDENGDWYDYRVDEPYDWYLVQCRWNYKENTKLNMSQFATSIYLAIIDSGNRLEIVEASEKVINAGKGSETNSTDQITENTETTSTETSTSTTTATTATAAQ